MHTVTNHHKDIYTCTDTVNILAWNYIDTSVSYSANKINVLKMHNAIIGKINLFPDTFI